MSNPSLVDYLLNHSAFKSLLKELTQEYFNVFGDPSDNLGLNSDTLKPKQDIITGFGNLLDGLKVETVSIGPSTQDTNTYTPRKPVDTLDVSQMNGTPFIKDTPPAKMGNVRLGYTELAQVLEEALEQAQNGKGNQRHQVNNAPFTQQPICELTRLYGLAYPFGQAAKKAHEVNQLQTTEAKIAELLGAINYLAAAVIVLKEQQDHNI